MFVYCAWSVVEGGLVERGTNEEKYDCVIMIANDHNVNMNSM